MWGRSSIIRQDSTIAKYFVIIIAKSLQGDFHHRLLEAPTGVCAIQVATIKNARLRVPVTALNVTVRIEYSHDGDIGKLVVGCATWWNSNPPGSDVKGTMPASNINLEPNEDQKIILSMQRNRDGAILASPDAGKQLQRLHLGHWGMFVTVESDNTPSLKLKGGITVIRSQQEQRDYLVFDDPAFTVVEEEGLSPSA